VVILSLCNVSKISGGTRTERLAKIPRLINSVSLVLIQVCTRISRMRVFIQGVIKTSI